MKMKVQQYSTSIHDAGVWDSATEAAIWDFYVTHALDGSSSQRRSVREYGIRELPYDEMVSSAFNDSGSCEMLLADSIEGVLTELDLKIEQGQGSEKKPKEIDIDSPRFACIQPYSIKDREGPRGRISKAEALLSHVRNSFAHGNTFWLPNGMLLLIDKGGGASGKTTAAILINNRSLLDWIGLIDKESKFYVVGSCANYASIVASTNKETPELGGGCCISRRELNQIEADLAKLNGS